MSGTNKPAWAEKFKLGNDVPMHGNFEGFGTINLSKLTLEDADNLLENGFIGLVLIEPKSLKKEKTS